MVKIKICGLRRQEDITYINAFPIDYAGFVFAHSKRQIEPSKARALIGNLQNAKSVGVFVNEPIERVLEIAEYCNLAMIQLHGDEDAAYLSALKQRTSLTIWKALRIQSAQDVEMIHTLPADRFLIDSHSEHSYGGTGTSIDQTLLKGIDLHDIMVAGGIQAETLAQIIPLHPYGIDVSSSLEVDGFKDKNKIAAFMKKLDEVRI